MPENLQTRLHNSLDEILKSSGYIFEIIDQNRKQSNVITSPNNELIQKSITQSLNGEIQNFHAILDQTVSKLNDAEWRLGVMVEKKKKLDELKVKEEAARKKEEEAKKKEEEVKKKAEEAKKCFILLFCQICTTFNLCANILFYLIFIYFYFTILFYRTFYIFSLSTHLLYNIFLRL
nr:telomere-associated protein RL [Candida albicans]